jgi:hypothetical protein
MIAIDLLAQAAIMAAVALGAWTAMGEGMVLSFVTRWAEMLPKWMAKPLATCPRCMCSAWGIAALFLLGYDFSSTWNIVQLPVLILTAVGIQELLYRP